jgi:cytidylate kinase
MVQPEGSLAIDTSGLTLNEVVDQIEMLILSKISYS